MEEYFNNISNELETKVVEYQNFLIRNILEFNNSPSEFYMKFGKTPRAVTLMDHMNEHSAEIIEELSISDIELIDLENQKIFFDYMIDKCLNKVEKHLKLYSKSDLLVLLYQLASYISESHNRIQRLHVGELTLSDLSITDFNEHILVNLILLFQGENKKYLSSVLGPDKTIIQYLIEFSLNYENFVNAREIKEFSVFEIFSMVGLLLNLIETKDIVCSRIYTGKKIRVSENKYTLDESVNDKIHDIIHNAHENDFLRFELGKSEEKVLFNNFSKQYGFNPYLLKDYIENFTLIPLDGDLSTLTNKATFVGDVIESCNCNFEEAIALFDYLHYSPSDIDNNKMFVVNYEKRIMANALMEWGPKESELLLISAPLLIYNYAFLRRCIYNNQFPDLEKSNSNILNSVNNELVKIVAKIINTNGLKCLSNFKDYYINKNGKKIKKSLPREIDILFAYDEILYIIECKNMSKKYSFRQMNNDNRKFYGFAKILRSNEKTLMALDGDIDNLLGSSFSKIEKMIVVQNYTSTVDTIDKGSDIKVLTVQEFRSFISSLTQ